VKSQISPKASELLCDAYKRTCFIWQPIIINLSRCIINSRKPIRVRSQNGFICFRLMNSGRLQC